jgi:hypothetical protein
MSESVDGKRLVQILSDPDNEFARILSSRRGGGQGLSVCLIDLNPFLNGLTEFFVDIGFVISVNTAKHEAGACANVALILF